MIRLAGALLSEQNDEWLVQRRYLSVESMALILAEPTPGQPRSNRRCRFSPPPETQPCQAGPPGNTIASPPALLAIMVAPARDPSRSFVRWGALHLDCSHVGRGLAATSRRGVGERGAAQRSLDESPHCRYVHYPTTKEKVTFSLRQLLSPTSSTMRYTTSDDLTDVIPCGRRPAMRAETEG